MMCEDEYWKFGVSFLRAGRKKKNESASLFDNLGLQTKKLKKIYES
jgi:hypothetical protein